MKRQESITAAGNTEMPNIQHVEKYSVQKPDIDN